MSDDPTSSDKQAKPVKIEVQLDEATAMGEYVNMARIFHTQTEFVLDALFVAPGTNKAKVRSRLILSPMHAKNLLAALGHNVRMYKSKFGEIKVAKGGPVLH